MAEQSKSHNIKIKIIKISIILGILIILAMVFIKTTKIKDVEVKAGKRYTQDEIKDMFVGGGIKSNALYVYFNYKYGEQEKIPFIEYVDVELTSINSLRLTAYDKPVIGCIMYMNQYIYFDNDGVFVETSEERLSDVVYLSGLEFSSITLNEAMDVGNDEVFDVVLNITQLIDDYDVKVDEIIFSKSYEVSLICGDIKVLLGKHDTYDEQIAKLNSILAKSEGLSGTLHMEKYSSSDEDIIFNKNP